MRRISTDLIVARSALRDGLAALKDYDGVTGKQSMGADGDMEKLGYLLVVINGKFRLLNE